MEFLHERKYSRIETEYPDRNEFPLYYTARKTVVEIEEGDMLFIPAGMFHFVVSERGDDANGLNFAINFWYENTTNPREHMVGKHNITDFSFIDMNKRTEFYKSKNKLFPPVQLLHRYPGLIEFDVMSFSEFLVTKNPHYYMLQNMNNDFDKLLKYSPDKTSKVEIISTWCNFGNGATSLMHYDEHDNWLCQIHGKKRVVLFPHEDRHLLYMWNPVDLRITKQLSSNYFTNFVMDLKNSIPQDLIVSISNENKQYFKNENMSLLLTDTVLAYEKKLQMMSCYPPSSILPWKFQLIKTNNIEYPKIGKHIINFPYIIFWVTSGKGYIRINETYSFNLEPRQLFMFPCSFLFNWRLVGDLEFITIST